MPDLSTPFYVPSATTSIKDIDLDSIINRTPAITNPMSKNVDLGANTAISFNFDNNKYGKPLRVFDEKQLQPVSGYNSFKEAPEYNPEFSSMQNLREYAGKQGTGEWLANSFAKLGVTAKDSFISTFEQNGRNFQALSKFDASKLYDTTDTSAKQEELRNLYPTYGTGELDNSLKRFIPWNFGKSDFGGEMLPQLGFTIGTMGETLMENWLIGMATGGLGEAYESVKTASNLAKVGQGLVNLFETANGITNFKKGLAVLNTIKNESTLGATIGQGAIKGAKLLANAYAMFNTAGGEAAFEANQAFNDQLSTLKDEFRTKNGYDAFGGDLRNIEDTARKTATSVFGWNIPILMGSNLIQFGNILKPFKGVVAETVENVGMELAGKGLKKTVTTVAEKEVTSTLGKIFKVAGKVGGHLAEPLSEGFEEFSQSVGQSYFGQYYKDLYNGLSPNTSLNNSLNAVFDYAGSKASQDDFFGGFIGGAVFKGVGKISEITGLQEKMGMDTDKSIAKRKQAITDQAVSILNSVSNDDLIKYLFDPEVQNYISQNANKTRLVDAAEKGDRLAFNDAKSASIRDIIYAGLATGKLDMALSKLDIFKELDNDELAEALNITDKKDIDVAKTNAAQVVEEIKQRATELESDWNDINRKYQNPYEKDSAPYKIYEQAKRDRLFSRDIVLDDQKRAKKLRGDIMSSSEVTDNVIDQAVDLDVLDKAIKDLDAFVKDAPDKNNLIYDRKKSQLSMLKEIQKERSKKSVDYKRLSELVFDLGNTNELTVDFGKDRDTNLKRIEDVLKLEDRNTKNVDDFLFLTNQSMSEAMQQRMDAANVVINKVKENKPSVTPTKSSPITITGDIKKDTELLKKLTGNSDAKILNYKGKFQAGITKGNSSSGVGDEYNSIEDLFSDIEKIKSLIPSTTQVIPTDSSDNLETSKEELASKQPAFETGKKDNKVIFQSSSRPKFEDRDKYPESLFRDEYLLNNIYNGNVKGNIKAIPVTILNFNNVEAKLGLAADTLKFLVPSDEYALSETNTDKGLVIFIYVKDNELIDKDGNPIKDDFEKRIVSSKLTSIDDSKLRATNTPEQSAQVKEIAQKIRKHFVDNTTYQEYPFTISQGIDNSDKTNFVTNSVTDSQLIKPEEINGDTIFIGTTTGVALHDNTTQTTINGRPYLKKVGKNPDGSNTVRYEYLDNRNLTDKQITQVKTALTKLSEKVKANKMNTKDVINTPEYIFISGIIQASTSNPKNTRQLKLVVGKDFELKAQFGTLDTKNVLINNFVSVSDASIDGWLKQRYHNVNKELLSKPFRDIDGKDYKTYTHYLLTSEEKPLTVRMPIPDNSEQPEIPIKQRYSIFDLKSITGEIPDIAEFKKTQVNKENKSEATVSRLRASRENKAPNQEQTQTQTQTQNQNQTGGSRLRRSREGVPQPSQPQNQGMRGSRLRVSREKENITNFSESTDDVLSGSYIPTPEEEAAAFNISQSSPQQQSTPAPKKVVSTEDSNLIAMGYDPEDVKRMTSSEKTEALKPKAAQSNLGTKLNATIPQSIPTLNTVKVDLTNLDVSELRNVKKQLEEKQIAASKSGGIDLSAASRQSDIETLDKLINEKLAAFQASKSTTNIVSPVDDLDDLDAAPFRLERVGEQTTEGITEAELEEVKRMLPQVGLKYNPNMERAFQGWRVWGSYKNHVINLYQGAVKGTGFHESFEVVFNSILTRSQQDSLLSEFRRKGGEFTNWKGETIRYKDASDLDAKEAIADGFMDWKANKSIRDEKQLNFFQKLWNFLSDFIKNIISPINRVYNNLESGKYATSTLRDTIGEYFKFGANESTEFEYLKSFSGLLFNKMNTDAVNILNGLNDGRYSEAELYNYLKNTADKIFNPGKYGQEEKVETSLILKQRASYILNNDPSISPEAASTMSKEEFREAKEFFNKTLTNNWDQFVQSHKNFLQHIGIGFTDLQTEKDEEDQRNIGDNKDRDYVPDPLKNDVKDSISNSIKLVLATITDSMFFRSKIDGTTRQMDIISSVTGLPNIITNYNKLFNRLLSHLSGYNNEEVIRKKLLEISEMTAEEKNLLMGTPIANIRAQFKQVYDKLLSTPIEDIDNEGELKLRLAFQSAFSKQSPVFLRNKISEDGNAYFADENYERIAKNAENKAINKVRNDSFNAQQNKDKNWWTKYDTSSKQYYINKQSNQLGEVQRANPNFKEGLINGLNLLGFDQFNTELIDNLSYDELSDLTNQYNSIASIIRGFAEKNRKFDKLSWTDLEVGGRIKIIAELYANKIYDESEPMHFNAEGEKQSNFIDGNHISFIISDINSLSEEDFYNKYPYFHPTSGDYFSKNSLLIKKLFEKKNRGEKLRLTILSGIEDEKGNGKKLSTASEQEIFITRFNASLQSKSKDAVYTILENADGSIDWALQSGRYVEPQDFDSPVLENLLSEYLSSEIGFALSFNMEENQERNENEILNSEQTLITGEKRKLGKSLQFFTPILGQDEEGINLVSQIHALIDGYSDGNPTEIAKEIISSLKLAPIVKDYFIKFATSEANKDKKYLSDNHYLQEVGQGTFDLFNIDGGYFSDGNTKGLSEYGVNQMLLDRQVNYIIHNIEMFKVFFGNPAYYKDGMKRFKSFMSPRLSTANSDILNKKLSQLSNSSIAYRRNSKGELIEVDRIDIPVGDATFHEYSSDLSFYSVDDIKTFNEVVGNTFDNYRSNESTDAQMGMLLAHIKEILTKSGAKWTNEQEQQLQLSNAYMRLKLSVKNNPKTSQPYYTYSSDNLKSRDLELLSPYISEVGETEDKNKYDLPALGYIAIVKPIQSGFKTSDIQEPSLIKTSVAPLTWQLVEGTKMEKIFLDMFVNKTGGFLYKSAHKVGQSVKGKIGKIINVNGSINYPSDVAIRESIPFSTIGIQVETQSQKNKSTVGTQIMKLLTADIYSMGVPRDYTSNETESVAILEEWNRLSQKDKINSSNLYVLDQKHYNALSNIFTVNYREFLNKFGITEDVSENGEVSFVYDSIENLHKEIYGYIEKHGVPTHILDQFQLNDDKSEFKVPLEMMQDYKTIKHIIYSMLDKNVLSPKLNGGQKIQMSSALFDKLNHSYKILYRNKKEKGDWKTLEKENVADFNEDTDEYVIGNTSLKFYEKGKQMVSEHGEAPLAPTSRMQIMLSSRLKRDLNKFRADNNLKSINDDELISWLKENQQELLNGVGFRIPTQALSSIDAFEIVGFLPEYLGDAVAVPAELPTKAGSDFDVDKLTTYLNNYKINKEGYPEYLQFKSTIQDTEDYYRELYYDEVQSKIEKLSDSKKAYFREKFIELVKTLKEIGDEDITIEEKAGEEMAYFANRFNDKIYSILDQFDNDDEAMESMAKQIVSIQQRVDKLSDADFVEAGAKVYVNKYLKKAIENQYFQSIADIVLTPENYEKLVSPNSSSEFEVDSNPDSITNKLLNLRGATKKDRAYNPAKFLSFTQMVKSRSIFTQAKDKVGISAVGGTSHANFQRFLTYLNTSKKEGMIWIGNHNIKFRHNSVSIDGISVPSISSIQKTDGNNILEYISKYTNGSVDVTKDDWLIKYGAYGDAFPVTIFSEKVGMDSYENGLMINHPFVKEYMRIKALKNSPVFKYNNIIRSEYDDLRTDEDYMKYFTRISGLKEYKENFSSFGAKEIKALEDHIRSGGESADVVDMLEANKSEYDKELALTNLRQFLQFKELSFDLLATMQTSNHETLNLNSNAIVPTKENNYITLKDKSPIRAMYSTEDGVKNVSAAEALRDTTFVGEVINNLKKTHQIVHEKLLLPQTNDLLNYMIGYLSFNNEKMLTVDKVTSAVEKMEDISINAQIHSARIPEQFTGFPGTIPTNINKIFLKGSIVYKNILLEQAKAHKKSEKQKADDGTLVLDYIELVPMEGSKYWYMKVKGKPKSSDLYLSNVFYQALRTLEVKKPNLFSQLMMSSIIQSGISFNDNNITNFLSPDIFNSLSEGVRNYTLTNQFFDTLKDLNVANTYFEKDNQFTTNLEYFPPLASPVSLNKNQILLDNRNTYTTEGELFDAISNENIFLLPSHRYKSELTGKTKMGTKVINKWSKEKFHKKNWGVGSNYIVVRKWNKKLKKQNYIILKKTSVKIDTMTENMGEYNPTTFFVYQKLPLRGTKFHSEYQLSNPLDPESANSKYADNPFLNLKTDTEIFEHLQSVANVGGIQPAASNVDKSLGKDNPIPQDIAVSAISMTEGENFKSFAPTITIDEEKPEVKRRDFISEEAIKNKMSFRGKPVILSAINTTKTTPVAASNDGKNIHVNIPLLKEKYEAKAWTKPAVQKDKSKVQPIGGTVFKSFDEFLTFVMIHEYKHFDIKKNNNETIGQYETRINNSALQELKMFYKASSGVVNNQEVVVPLPENKGMKIISGGQTGADRLGLDVAKELGIPTGGTATKGYRTEKGSDFSLKEFGLTEHPSTDYPPRTEDNIKNSDTTVLFGDDTSTGSKLTVNLANKYNKPIIINPNAQELRDFIKETNTKTLNVAGNRASKLTTKQIEDYKNVLREALSPKEIKQSDSINIYSQLGNKTVSENVVIKPWSELENAETPYTEKGEIVSTRITNTIPNYLLHFGNPFSHDPSGKTQGLIKTASVKEAVEKYIEWLTTSNLDKGLSKELNDRKAWILSQLKSGDLKGKSILYYKELGEPSHATALDYLINKYNWGPNTEEVKPTEVTPEAPVEKPISRLRAKMNSPEGKPEIKPKNTKEGTC